jgi:hypothetical protein
MKMVDVNTIYTSDTLKAADLQGREHTVTIASVESKEFDNGIKLVLKFVGAKKSFVCNRTNGKRIAFMHGDETNGWINKKIVLAPEMQRPIQTDRGRSRLVREDQELRCADAATSSVVFAARFFFGCA